MANGGAPDYLYFVLPLAVLASCLWLGPLFSGKHRRGEDAYTALLSPSVRTAANEFDRRVAIAVREAKLGFCVCVGCGFTNPVRAKTCVLCGAAVQPKKKGIKALLGASDERPSTTTLPPLLPFASLTTRQQRVRSRKEWSRAVLPNGAIVWRHDDTFRDRTVRAFPSFVIESKQQHRHSAPASSGDHIEIVVEPQEPEVEILTIEQVVKMLQRDIKATHVATVNVGGGDDASVRTAIVPLDATDRSVDSVGHADLDFPSKLAHFITTMAGLFHEAADHDEHGDEIRNKSRLFIDRDNLLSDSVTAMATMTPLQARGAIRVEFTNEQGIDAGGVYREWFLLLNLKLVAPATGIFTCVDPDEQVYYLNPHSREALGVNHLAYCLATGRLLGRALLEGNVTGFHLALPLLKIILGIPVSVSDLQYFDAEAYKNLLWLLENDGVDALGLDFTITEKRLDGTTRQIELVPRGAETDVTDDNKHEFVHRKVQYLLIESVSDQLHALLRGLYEIVPPDLFMLFDAEELDYMQSGSDEIDVDDWQAHTITTMELVFHPAYELFWKIVRELSDDELRRLLQFSTGSTRVPPGGFGALTSHDGQLCLFTLKGVPPETTYGYLHSHTCFNTLEVPLHGFAGNMRTAVRASIEGQQVGFTTA